MHLVTNPSYPTSIRMLVICPIKTEERLKTTCFRGRNQKLAGNFKLWESVEEMFKSSAINELKDDFWEQWRKCEFGTHSVTIEMPVHIGWESTANKDKYPMDTLEEFCPNRRSTALRIRSNRTEHLAPLTKDITIVYQLEDQRGEPKVTIWSLYPGDDIGELVGDITQREGRVFFDWNHPGE